MPSHVETTQVSSNSLQHATQAVSLLRLSFWLVLFQLAWYFQPLVELLQHGAMADPDDYLRLHEVMIWLQGQGWYDTSVPRMNAPFGGDLHWSRLVDVPIAVIGHFFALLLGTEMGFRTAAVIWPTALLLVMLQTLIAISERIYPAANRLLVVLFALTNVTALSLFAPGRIDHHNVQILLIFLAVLGTLRTDRWWGYPLAGLAMALSVAVGSENYPLIVLMLAWLGLAWALELDRDGRGLRQTGLSMLVSISVLYPLLISPDQWLVARCDAFSPYYGAALGLVSVSFLFLSMISPAPSNWRPVARIASRAGFGGLAAGASAALLWIAFPECRAGPLAQMDPALVGTWLANIHEAQGMMAFAERFGVAQYALPLYLAFILTAAIVILRHGLVPALKVERIAPVLAIAAICLVLGFVQVRVIRIGIFAVVPVCVILADIAWRRYALRGDLSRQGAMLMTVTVCLPLISPVWMLAASKVLPAGSAEQQVETALPSENPSVVPAWQKRGSLSEICNWQEDYAFLGSQPEGTVMNDLNSGPAILLFTQHAVIGGNYHRNADAILDTFAFFRGEEAEALRIANKRSVDYVAFCQARPVSAAQVTSGDTMGDRLLSGREPAWLKQISPVDDRMRVYRILR